jgi:serine/threonine-protein kinase
MPREELSACVESPETDAKLQDDVAWATEHGIEGTPMVLLDGRPAAPFGPLLFALILTQGDATHPIFASLPEGVLRDPHEGHDH